MTISKTLISALGLTVALAFSAPMFTATSANAAGTSAQTETNTQAPMKAKKHHKKSTHKKHHKKTPQSSQTKNPAY
ncbi:hypothetical protein [Mesorhizobium sp. KR2-14]|uniref:hypothetical protein n=1 Tax=Mesorhizobium sp. KR2-14 TaxID=3156610 RepID=UPI0032B5EF0F